MRRQGPLVVLIAAALLTGCGSRAPLRRPFTPVASHVRSPRHVVLPAGSGAVIAWVVRSTALRASPQGRTLAVIGSRTGFGSPDVLYVAQMRTAWVGVRSEFAGNGRLAWIPRTAVLLSRVHWSVRASLSRRILTVQEGGRVLRRYRIGVGASGSPTPTGSFAVTDRLLTGVDSGPYGCCILALTATSPHAIPGWTGGNRIAIHATPATETIGQPDSHGCLHVTNAEGRWLVNHVPDGTPVVISG